MANVGLYDRAYAAGQQWAASAWDAGRLRDVAAEQARDFAVGVAGLEPGGRAYAVQVADCGVAFMDGAIAAAQAVAETRGDSDLDAEARRAAFLR